MHNVDHDQATGLRRLFARETLQVLSVRGADGSATVVTLDLATALVALGHRPLVIDLEKGEAAHALGLTPRYELAHALRGDKALRAVLLTHRDGIAVLPAMRGLELAARSGSWQRAIGDLLRDAKQTFNIWLVNGAAPAFAETEPPLLVIAPTREAITGAYAQIKGLARAHGQREFRIVVDRAASESVARSVFASIAETSRRFLSAQLDYCGYLPHEPRRTRPTGAHSLRAHAFAQLAEAVFAAMPAPAAHLAGH